MQLWAGGGREGSFLLGKRNISLAHHVDIFFLHRVINILESVLSLGSRMRVGGLKVDSLDGRLTLKM